MILLALKVRTALRLGLKNIIRVIVYRFGVFAGINPVRRLVPELVSSPFYSPNISSWTGLAPRKGWYNYRESFGIKLEPLFDQPPNWFPGNSMGAKFRDLDWWRISDFEAEIPDIKVIWEPSRFDWVISCSQQVIASRAGSMERLEHWLSDWCVQNPAYKGPNWKCGQEASIRVIHLATSALLLGQHTEITDGMRALVVNHLQRISPTIIYAIAQDNNHGTSEAAALFIGGSWLVKSGYEEGVIWQNKGRKWLEDRTERLVGSDGSFSQYSVNYHRLLLDTLSIVELWRQKLDLLEFSALFYSRSRAATNWLYALVQAKSGDVPNVGANDGARLIPLSDTDFRDFRPSVQLAAALFLNRNAYGKNGSWNSSLVWLGVEDQSDLLPPPTSEIFSKGGFGVFRDKDAMVLLRFPRYRFRPSHADALHLDFWLDGENILRDGGTFSYNADAKFQSYFPGTKSHNTVQFDGRDQMSKISRFLFGNWLNSSIVTPFSAVGGAQSFAVEYIDGWRCYHRRDVSLVEGTMTIIDEIGGFSKNAVLRWRLRPDDWNLDDNTVRSNDIVLSVTCSESISRMELVSGWESRYYSENSLLPVLEIEVDRACKLVTTIKWNRV